MAHVCIFSCMSALTYNFSYVCLLSCCVVSVVGFEQLYPEVTVDAPDLEISHTPVTTVGHASLLTCTHASLSTTVPLRDQRSMSPCVQQEGLEIPVGSVLRQKVEMEKKYGNDPQTSPDSPENCPKSTCVHEPDLVWSSVRHQTKQLDNISKTGDGVLPDNGQYNQTESSIQNQVHKKFPDQYDQTEGSIQNQEPKKVSDLLDIFEQMPLKINKKKRKGVNLKRSKTWGSFRDTHGVILPRKTSFEEPTTTDVKCEGDFLRTTISNIHNSPPFKTKTLPHSYDKPLKQATSASSGEVKSSPSIKGATGINLVPMSPDREPDPEANKPVKRVYHGKTHPLARLAAEGRTANKLYSTM